MDYTYRTKGTCSREISFELDGDRVKNVHFVGGCDGNLKAVAKLVDGMTVEQIETMLRGNTCGPRPTSCADQTWPAAGSVALARKVLKRSSRQLRSSSQATLPCAASGWPGAT